MPLRIEWINGYVLEVEDWIVTKMSDGVQSTVLCSLRNIGPKYWWRIQDFCGRWRKRTSIFDILWPSFSVYWYMIFQLLGLPNWSLRLSLQFGAMHVRKLLAHVPRVVDYGLCPRMYQGRHTWTCHDSRILRYLVPPGPYQTASQYIRSLALNK
jgi:hypothetical protein